MFKSKSGAAAAEPVTDTSTNSGSTLNQKIAPSTPAVARGQNKKARIKMAEIMAKHPAPNLTVQIDNTQQTASVIKMRRDENGDLVVTKEQPAQVAR